MSLHGLRRQAAFALLAVMELATSATAMAQQASRSVDDVVTGGGSGFTVIEDTPRPSAAGLPPNNPVAYASATTAPLGAAPGAMDHPQAATASGKPVKPGDAVYELPFVKPTSTGSGVGVASAVKPGTPSASPTAVASDAKVPSVVAPPPPKPAWEGKAPTDAKAMLMVWAKKAGWSAIWDASYTFPVPSDVRYDGTFEQAVSAHYAAYTDRRRTKTPVCVDMHRNNRTVHVYQPDDSGKCDDAFQQSATSTATATSSTDKKATP